MIGNVGRDPDIRHNQDGKPIANLSLATTENWKDKHTGEKRSRTEWHRLVVFSEGMAKVVEKYVHKGSKIYVEGKIATREWEDQEGVKKYVTEIILDNFSGRIVLLGDRRDRQNGDHGNGHRQDGVNGPESARDRGEGSQDRGRSNHESYDPPFDDDIPF
ncbi:MAG: single-stranded DNA-binding protein [Devosia sp.]